MSERARIPADLEDAVRNRYADRPQQLAEVLANAEAWERLKAVAEPLIRPANAAE